VSRVTVGSRFDVLTMAALLKCREIMEANQMPPVVIDGEEFFEVKLRSGEIGAYEGIKFIENAAVKLPELRASSTPYYRRFERKRWGRS
jgi:hypothetical protein